MTQPALGKQALGADKARAVELSIVTVFALVSTVKAVFYNPGYMWLLRLALGVTALLLVIGLHRFRRVPRSALPYLSPFLLALLLTVSTLASGGDKIHFLVLLGVSAAAPLYGDRRGLITYFALIGAMTAFIVYVLHFPLLEPSSSKHVVTMHFLTFNVFNGVMFAACHFSISESTDAGRRRTAFEVVMDATPSCMAVLDDRARVRYISRSFQSLLSIPSQARAGGLPMLDLLASSAMRMEFQSILEHLEPYADDELCITHEGAQRWFTMRSMPFVRGRVARFLELHDITPVVKARNAAEVAAKNKASFLANMSHEIRTPMNAILGMTDLLMISRLTEEQSGYAAAIKTASMSLLKIINDILDFSKIDTGEIQILPAPFPLASLITDTINLTSIRASGIAYTVLVQKDLPAVIDGDEMRIKQVLINILGNAIKFTSAGCVSLIVSGDSEKDGNLRLRFSVVDTGIGIRERDIQKLFGQFEQVDSVKNRKGTGTGLGLSISRRMVQLMGGEIRVASVYGEGSTFSFDILCGAVGREPLASLTNPGAMRALCFERNPYHARALREMLTDLGVAHEVTSNEAEFAAKTGDGYTHVLFDRSAIDAAMCAEGARFILINEPQARFDRRMPNVEQIGKPVMVTALARALEGARANTAPVKKDVRIGDITTRGVRALIVDDNEVNLMVAEEILQRYGIETSVAHGGREGIDAVRDGHFDIVFMDHMMPGVDGIDATKAIRAMGGAAARLPVIALTANAITGMREEFLAAGMDDYLTKPMVIGSLHDILLKHLPEQKIFTKVGDS